MITVKSIGAVLAGFLTVVVLSIGTDFVLESLGLFPPQNEPAAYTWGMLLVALIYRMGFTVAGGYVTAKLAPTNPMRHVIILGIIGMTVGTLGAIVTWDMTPEHWYPVALVITALPCTWFGGRLYSNRQQNLGTP